MLAVVVLVVSLCHPRQAHQARLGLVHVVGQLRPRVRVTLARLDVLPTPWLILVVRMVLLVLHPKPLGLHHKRPLLALREQTVMAEVEFRVQAFLTKTNKVINKTIYSQCFFKKKWNLFSTILN